MNVFVCRQDIEDTIVDGKQGDIERATAVVDNDPLHTVELVRAVSDSGSSGLVDDMGI